MSMFVYKAQLYCSYLVYDSSLKLFTPIFNVSDGLSKFEVDFGRPLEMKDVDQPSGAVDHIAYHEKIDVLIKSIDSTYSGRSLDLKHGHMSASAKSMDNLLSVALYFARWPKKPRIISMEVYTELTVDIQRCNKPAGDGSSSSTGN